MLTEREDPNKAAWHCDRLDSLVPPIAEAPYFDNSLNAWIFTRYADILAAFRASELSPIPPNSSKPDKFPNEEARLKIRNDVQHELSPSNLRDWKESLAKQSEDIAERLSLSQNGSVDPVDLLNDYARPLCLALAATVAGISQDEARHLSEKAQTVSAAAAEPYDPELLADATSADASLRKCFHTGPESMRSSTFIALSQTIPRLLGNAWFALIQHPEQWSLLHQQPELTEQAIEELFRYAGLVRILARTATTDISINGTQIRTGERIILRIIAANRDPNRFVHPNEVDITRRGASHLTLGAGLHSCVGASLIRMAAVTVTYPLVARFASARLAQNVEWQGGSGFLSPKSLKVSLNR